MGTVPPEALLQGSPSVAQPQQPWRHVCVRLQIDLYEKLYEEVSKFENMKVFSGWLQSDCRPFKQALLNTVKRWSLMFKQHLVDHVTTR